MYERAPKRQQRRTAYRSPANRFAGGLLAYLGRPAPWQDVLFWVGRRQVVLYERAREEHVRTSKGKHVGRGHQRSRNIRHLDGDIDTSRGDVLPDATRRKGRAGG